MQIKVWDLPTRVFHWGLLLALIGSYGTAELGWLDMQWHFRFGYVVLALVLFRILWGMFGPRYARFSQFLRGPRAVWRYLRGDDQRWLGHNPLGGWAVIVLLAVVLLQTLTGLFNGDDIEWFGPLHDQVSSATQRFAHRWHDRGFYAVLTLSGIHVIAVLLYLLLRKQNLIGPMLHGSKDGDAEQAAQPGSLLILAVCIAVSVSVVVAIVYLGPG